ncbi:hypothetical protein DFH28DRAFT_909499 [Melampsora americana]|nr:hypothetical protein DFH28DRAFT_909499 [Melampsora americana]
MLPPFRASVSKVLIPQMISLAVHNQDCRPTLAQDNPPEQARLFEIHHHGFYYITAYKQPLVCHIERYNCLKTQELQKLHNTIIATEGEIQDGYQELSEAQNIGQVFLDWVYQYARMLSRSPDLDVIVHRNLLKKQLKYSRERYVDLKYVSKTYNKHIGKLWAIYSRKIEHTCDFQDAEARETNF